MTNFFMAGSDLVAWEIVTVAGDGPYRLSVVHPKGTIVEYFTTTADALRRERELEALFVTVTPQPAGALVSSC